MGTQPGSRWYDPFVTKVDPITWDTTVLDWEKEIVRKRHDQHICVAKERIGNPDEDVCVTSMDTCSSTAYKGDKEGLHKKLLSREYTKFHEFSGLSAYCEVNCVFDTVVAYCCY